MSPANLRSPWSHKLYVQHIAWDHSLVWADTRCALKGKAWGEVSATGALWGTETAHCSPVSSFRAWLLDSGRGWFPRVWCWEGWTWLRYARRWGLWSRKISLLPGGSVCGGSVWVSARTGAAKRPGGPDWGRAHWPGSGWISGSLFCVWGTLKELLLRATVGPSGCHFQALLPKGNFLIHLGTFRKSQRTGEEGRGKLLNLLHRSS